MSKRTSQTAYRQGDVLLLSCKEPAKLGESVSGEKGNLILAVGESSHHAHVIAARRVRAFMVGTVMYLNVLARAKLRTVETRSLPWREDSPPRHEALFVEPGWYEIRHQREWHAGEIRRVVD